ncbi:hypothetical protein [Clostridioides sp. ZZV14-6345]|uniref:hypothetical protein n=1 Tax=Clostridioides sp. ZZV14-6345 TaxID=2811496 RepID=UPI001D107F3C|nr:hypothetical protein [Clostridioides sp. ZZV14-6345]
MKKILLCVIIGILGLTLVACSSTASGDKINGIEIVAKETSAEQIKADCNQDGSYNENGEYFQMGLDAAKASDYEYKIVNVSVKNTSDEAIKLFQTGWNATAKDGYEFEHIKVTDKLENQQVPANYSFDAQVKIPVEKKMNVKEIILKYNLKDYSNLTNAMKDASAGATKEDIQKKYPELYDDNWIELGTIKFE